MKNKNFRNKVVSKVIVSLYCNKNSQRLGTIAFWHMLSRPVQGGARRLIGTRFRHTATCKTRRHLNSPLLVSTSTEHKNRSSYAHQLLDRVLHLRDGVVGGGEPGRGDALFVNHELGEVPLDGVD